MTTYTRERYNHTRRPKYSDDDLAREFAAVSRGIPHPVVVDARDFAIDPRGRNDSTAEVQKLLNQAAGVGRSHFPRGTYALTSAVSVPSNTVIIGEGRDNTIFRAASTHTGSVFVGAGNGGDGVSNVLIRDLQVDGNKASRSAGTNLIHFTCTDGQNNSEIHLENVYAHDSLGTAGNDGLGIVLSRLRGGSLRNIRVANNERDGITFYFDCQDIQLLNIRVKDCGDDFIGLNAENASTTGHTMKKFVMSNLILSGQTNAGSGIALRGCQDVEISNFSIDEAFSEGIGISNWNTSAAGDIRIAHGKITNAGANNSGANGFGLSIVAARSNSSLNGVANCEAIRVTDVACVTPRIYGVRVLNSNSASALVSDVKFTDINCIGPSTNTSGRGFYGDTDGCEDVEFHNCTAWDQQVQGYFFTGAYKRIKFYNCNSYGAGQNVGSGSTSSVGVHLIGAIDPQIVGGSFTDLQAGGSRTARFGVRMQNCTGTPMVVGANLSNNVGSAFSNAGGNDTVLLAGNRPVATVALSSDTGYAIIGGDWSAAHIAMDSSLIQAKASATTAAPLGLQTLGSYAYTGAGSNISLSGVTGAFLVGGDGTGQHLALDGNEIMSKSSATAATTLNVNKLGGDVNHAASLTTENTDVAQRINSGTNSGSNNKIAVHRFQRGGTDLWDIGLRGDLSTDGAFRVRDVANNVTALALAPSTGVMTIPGYHVDGVVSPTQLTADQNDYAPTGQAVGTWRLTSNAARNITGIANGVAGRSLRIINVGSNNIVLQNQNAGSVDANKIITGTGADVTLAADDTAMLWYDGTTARWRILNTH